MISTGMMVPTLSCVAALYSLAEGHDVHALPRTPLAQCLRFGSSSAGCHDLHKV